MILSFNLVNLANLLILSSFLLTNVSQETDLGQWLSQIGTAIGTSMTPMDVEKLIEHDIGTQNSWDYQVIFRQNNIVATHLFALKTQNGRNVTKSFVCVFDFSYGDLVCKQTDLPIPDITKKIKEALSKYTQSEKVNLESIIANL